MSSLPALCCFVALCIIGEHGVTSKQTWSLERGPFGPMMSIDAQNISSMENEQGLGKERIKRQHGTISCVAPKYMQNQPDNPWMVGLSPNPTYQNPLNVLAPGVGADVGITVEDNTEIKLVLPLFNHEAATIISICFDSIYMDGVSVVVRGCGCNLLPSSGISYAMPDPLVWTMHCFPLGGTAYSKVKSVDMQLHQFVPVYDGPIQVRHMSARYCDGPCTNLWAN